MKKRINMRRIPKRIQIFILVTICLVILGLNYYPMKVLFFEKNFDQKDLIQTNWDKIKIRGNSYEEALTDQSKYISLKDTGKKTSFSVSLNQLSNLTQFNKDFIPDSFESLKISFVFRIIPYGFLGSACGYKNLRIQQITTNSGFSISYDLFLLISSSPNWGKLEFNVLININHFKSLYEHLNDGEQIDSISLQMDLAKESDIGIVAFEILQIQAMYL